MNATLSDLLTHGRRVTQAHLSATHVFIALDNGEVITMEGRDLVAHRTWMAPTPLDPKELPFPMMEASTDGCHVMVSIDEGTRVEVSGLMDLEFTQYTKTVTAITE